MGARHHARPRRQADAGVMPWGWLAIYLMQRPRLTIREVLIIFAIVLPLTVSLIEGGTALVIWLS